MEFHKKVVFKFLFFGFLLIPFTTIGQSVDEFEKVAKKAAKKPQKKKNKEDLTTLYLSIQASNVDSLQNLLVEVDYTYSQKMADFAKSYASIKQEYSDIYSSTPAIEGEEKLGLILEQLKHDYYQKGAKLVEQETKEGYIKALDYLSLVKVLDPNYENIVALYTEAEENAKYDILLDYDMGNFPEHDRLMREVLNDINITSNNYDNDKRTYHYNEVPGEEYQLTYLVTFKYLDLGSTNKKTDSKEFQRTINGQVKRAQVNLERFERNSKVSGVFTIMNNVTGETIEKDQFNFNFDTKQSSAIINGDTEAIDPMTLRDFQKSKGSEVDVENAAIQEFKDRITQILERHLRYNYTSGS